MNDPLLDDQVRLAVGALVVLIFSREGVNASSMVWIKEGQLFLICRSDVSLKDSITSWTLLIHPDGRLCLALPDIVIQHTRAVSSAHRRVP